MEQSAAADLTTQTDALAQTLGETPGLLAKETATAGMVNHQAGTPPTPANDTTGRVSETLRLAAEKHVSDYIGAHLSPEFLAAPVAPDTTPPLTLDFRPSLVAGHEDLVLHFKGKEAAADPMAFEQAMVSLLEHHPYFAQMAKRAEHKPVAHSGTCNCCSVELKLPHLSEQEFRKLTHQLASTPAESLTPLVDAPHVPLAATVHAAGTPIVAPSHPHPEHPPHGEHAHPAAAAAQVAQAAAMHPHSAAAPLPSVANDNESPQLEGKLANPEIAAER